MTSIVGQRTAAGLLAGAILACSSSANTPTAPSCPPVAIDRFKELMIVEPSVIQDARAMNASDGPWSFRHFMEEFAGPGADASDFTMNWLQSYGSNHQVNGYSVPARVQVDTRLCPWLLSTPSNTCDATCTTCTARKLDLSVAPFRLMAISNRLDLHVQQGQAGEGRLLYAFTVGPGDLASSAPQDMSVILEFAQVTDAAVGEGAWASRWHALASYPDFGDGYKGALAAIVAQYAQASSLNQLRTNERVFDWAWTQRQYELRNGQLVLGALVNTPDPSLNGSSVLTQFVQQNAPAVLATTAKLPPNLTGGLSHLPQQWTVPGVSEDLRHAFAAQTCSGCHGAEHPALDIAFHVSPYESGVARLSPFLNNPADNTADELARRATTMQLSLCLSP